jgi:ATP-binding cassette, subfamily B, bacterial PglK
MFDVLKKTLSLLTKREIWQLFWLSICIMIMALMEVAGIASIMPFIAVISNPQIVETNQWLNWIFERFGFNSTNSFFLFLGSIVLFFIIISNSFKALVIWLDFKFIFGVTCNMSRRLFMHYLSKPYSFYLNQNTQVLGKNFLMEVIQFTGNVLKPTTEIFSKFFVTLFILLLIFYVDPILSSVIFTVLAVAYFFLYNLVEQKLERLGHERLEANSLRFKLAGEAFGGIKELKVLGRESFFTDHYTIHAKRVAKTVTIQQTISQIPRFVIEALSFGGIIIILLYFLMFKGDVISTLPIIALYAFAGYRLLPALQSIFSSLTTIRFNLSVIDTLKESFVGTSQSNIEVCSPITTCLPFNDEICLENVSFYYNGVTEPVIHNMNLIIKKNATVGIVGTTGSGKTTTVDVILGLLEPQEGVLKIDGVRITSSNVAKWQKNLGYVPQNIYLTDDTIAANIAYGIPHDNIEMKLVERAGVIANLHSFISEDLPFGYYTHVGERGIRLSGVNANE